MITGNLILPRLFHPKRIYIPMVPQENLLQHSLRQISELSLVKPNGSSKYNKWTKYRITLLWSHGLSLFLQNTQWQNVSFFFTFTITSPPTLGQLGKCSWRRRSRTSSSLKKWTPSISAASCRRLSRWHVQKLMSNDHTKEVARTSCGNREYRHTKFSWLW